MGGDTVDCAALIRHSARHCSAMQTVPSPFANPLRRFPSHRCAHHTPEFRTRPAAALRLAVMWRSLSLAPAPLAILHALPSAVAAAVTSTCLRAPALQHSARAVAQTCSRSFHSRASERAPTLLHSRVPVRCASLFPAVRPAVAIRRASPPAAVSVAATSLHTSAPTCALNFARRMRFFSRTCNPVAAPPPGADAELAAAAACDTFPSSPNLFDASHLLSNLEDKRENLHFLEVSADGGHHRDVCFSRGELSSTLELHPRDLRFLDASMRNLPSILARKKVIIVNLEVRMRDISWQMRCL